MSLLVTGSIGIDTVTTPYGLSEDCLGGSAVYFSMAAGFFCDVRLVGVVGDDCPFDLSEIFAGRNIDLDGLEIRTGSKTFRWKGSYEGSMNQAKTDAVRLNVLAEAPPVVPEKFRDSQYLFLANTAPALQIQLLDQIKKPQFVAADTMNCWIEGHTEDLKKLLKRINCLIINDDEAKMLSGEFNLVKAASDILEMGPAVVIVKKGDSGSLVADNRDNRFVLPAVPTDMVKDPTGAGDSFAGGFMGYLAEAGRADFESIKKAVACGTAIASFTISDFSLRGLTSIKKGDIENRIEMLRKVTSF